MPACVQLVVVTGRDHEALVKVMSRAHVKPLIVHNVDPARGQLSSLWVGMDAVVNADTEGILVTLVDVPMVAASTVTRVVTAWQRTRAPIVRPAIGDRHGHPVIFDSSVLDSLRGAPVDAGAKTVVRAHERDLLNVPVDDEDVSWMSTRRRNTAGFALEAVPEPGIYVFFPPPVAALRMFRSP